MTSSKAKPQFSCLVNLYTLLHCSSIIARVLVLSFYSWMVPHVPPWCSMSHYSHGKDILLYNGDLGKWGKSTLASYAAKLPMLSYALTNHLGDFAISPNFYFGVCLWWQSSNQHGRWKLSWLTAHLSLLKYCHSVYTQLYELMNLNMLSLSCMFLMSKSSEVNFFTPSKSLYGGPIKVTSTISTHCSLWGSATLDPSQSLPICWLCWTYVENDEVRPTTSMQIHNIRGGTTSCNVHVRIFSFWKKNKVLFVDKGEFSEQQIYGVMFSSPLYLSFLYSFSLNKEVKFSSW